VLLVHIHYFTFCSAQSGYQNCSEYGITKAFMSSWGTSRETAAFLSFPAAVTYPLAHYNFLPTIFSSSACIIICHKLWLEKLDACCCICWNQAGMRLRLGFKMQRESQQHHHHASRDYNFSSSKSSSRLHEIEEKHSQVVNFLLFLSRAISYKLEAN
jgi:hypothetical protein